MNHKADEDKEEKRHQWGKRWFVLAVFMVVIWQQSCQGVVQ